MYVRSGHVILFFSTRHYFVCLSPLYWRVLAYFATYLKCFLRHSVTMAWGERSVIFFFFLVSPFRMMSLSLTAFLTALVLAADR